MFKSIINPVLTTIEIEKSKFICNLIPVSSEADAQLHLNKLRDKHSDATHNCYAYYINEGQIQKCSDDGEPAKTAGYPILQAIINNNINNVLCVVTRYFGGIKLGTGGLMRAYGASALESINEAETATFIDGLYVVISAPYHLNSKVERAIQKLEANIIETNYFDIVSYKICIKEESKDTLISQLNTIDSTNIIIDFKGKHFYLLNEVI